MLYQLKTSIMMLQCDCCLSIKPCHPLHSARMHTATKYSVRNMLKSGILLKPNSKKNQSPMTILWAPVVALWSEVYGYVSRALWISLLV